MKPTQSSLFSSNSPWKDGIEPVFQTGQFAIAQQQQINMMANLNRYYPQMPQQYQIPHQRGMQRGSFQSIPSPMNQQQNTPKQQSSNQGGVKPSLYKEQFQQIFNQDQENVHPQTNTSRSHHSYNDSNGRRESNQPFQVEAAKVVVSIQSNLMGIIQGIQKNIVKSVNSNVNHQLKKQRYLVRKKHEEMIQYMNDQERVRGAKFPHTYSPSEKKQQMQNRAERSASEAIPASALKATINEGLKPIIAEIQLKEKSQSQQNKNTYLNIKDIQKVKEYNGGDSDLKLEQSNSNKNQVKQDTSRSITSYHNNSYSNTVSNNNYNISENNNKTIKDEEVFNKNKRNSQDNGFENQTIKNTGQRGNINIPGTSQNINYTNNKQTISRKYDQLFEETIQTDGLQQSALKNEFLDENNSLAYTLDDEISKASVFFGNNRDSIAFDQSRNRLNMSKNNSQVQQQQQYKNKFNEVEEVDLDDVDNIDWDHKNKQNRLKNVTPSYTTPSTSQVQQQYNSKVSERSPVSDKYDDEGFEELLDEDEIDDNFTNNKKYISSSSNLKNDSNVNKNNTKSNAQQASNNSLSKQTKQNKKEDIVDEEDDDTYKYNSDEFDLDDF